MNVSEYRKQLATEHRIKADRFLKKARKFYNQSDEDAARIFAFYSAFHALHFALANDPIFDAPANEFEKLTLRFKGLHRESYNPTHHNGHAGSRGVGMNQVVSYLYPRYHFDYIRLHETSVYARYICEKDIRVFDDTHDALLAAEKIVVDAFSGKIVFES